MSAPQIDVLETVLKSMKLEAEVVHSEYKEPYRRYWLRLGPSCTINKLNNKSAEIGLALRSNEPMVTPWFNDGNVDSDLAGTVCLEVIDGKHPVVHFDELAERSGFSNFDNLKDKYELPCLVGTTEVTEPLIIDLFDFPHMLVAGQTGSGKSIGLHTLIHSLAMHADANRVRLALIDPKHVEFARYNDMACLAYDVATEPDQVMVMMKNLIEEMEKRLRIMKQAGCANLKEYRAKTGHGSYLVVVIDELADLMRSTKGKRVEDSKNFEKNLERLCAKARSAGIHIVAATQYPHTDVITGTIKANFDGRLSFRVAESTHSRVMLGSKNDQACNLQGKGDAFLNGGEFKMQRFRGALTSNRIPGRRRKKKTVVSPDETPGFWGTLKSLFAAKIG